MAFQRFVRMRAELSVLYNKIDGPKVKTTSDVDDLEKKFIPLAAERVQTFLKHDGKTRLHVIQQEYNELGVKNLDTVNKSVFRAPSATMPQLLEASKHVKVATIDKEIVRQEEKKAEAQRTIDEVKNWITDNYGAVAGAADAAKAERATKRAEEDEALEAVTEKKAELQALSGANALAKEIFLRSQAGMPNPQIRSELISEGNAEADVDAAFALTDPLMMALSARLDTWKEKNTAKKDAEAQYQELKSQMRKGVKAKEKRKAAEEQLDELQKNRVQIITLGLDLQELWRLHTQIVSIDLTGTYDEQQLKLEILHFKATIYHLTHRVLTPLIEA
ncbi:hypothetical protein GF342_02600 [Candidatus Woesearchaeota archaeon]|nr:hypothetical protein [Candidatus Woesearchaeota archaeon]